MAFLLRRSARTLSNVSQKVQICTLSSRINHSLNSKSLQTCRRGTKQMFQSLSSVTNALFSDAAPVEVANDSISNSDRNQDRETSSGTNQRPRELLASMRFKTKSVFLKHFEEQLSEGETLTTSKAFVLIKSCGRYMVGETNAARNELVNYVWSELEKNGVKLEIGLWNTLLSVYIENRHEFEPLDFLKNLWQNSNSEPNKTTFSLLIQAYAMQGDPVGAMKIVEFMMQNDGKMTEHIYGWLVQAFAKNGDMDGVNEILKSMRDNNLQPRHATYGHLIDAHAERGDFESINQTMSEMIEHNFYPTSNIYISMLDHLSIGGHTEVIKKVWEKIEGVDYIKEDIRPLIQRFITRGDYESALTLVLCTNPRKSKYVLNYEKFVERRLFYGLQFSEKDIQEYLNLSSMLERHFNQEPLSRIPYLIEFFIQQNKNDIALKLLADLVEDGKPVTIQMFHPLIKYYAEKKSIPDIVEVFNFAIDKGIQLDYYCYKFVAPALGDPSSEDYQLFLQLIKQNDKIVLPYGFASEMFKSEDVNLQQMSGLVKSVSTGDLFGSLKSIKNALISDFNPEDAIEVIKRLHEKGMRNVAILCDEVLSKLVSQDANRAEEALAFVRGLIENDIPLNSNSYTKILRSLHQNRMADQFFMFVRLMKEHGVDPDVHHYYQMLKMASTVGNSMAAQFCFDKVKDSEAFPKRKGELYEYLITAYSRDTENVKIIPTYIQDRDSENALKVVHLFQEMIENGYKPSNEIVTTVIKSHLLARDVEGANKVIEQFGEGKEELKKSVQNSFIRAYVARKEFDRAEELFGELKEKSMSTQLQYNEMMRICEFTGNTNKVEELFSEMLSRGFQPNVFTYLHRIRTYLTARNPEPCIGIIEENIASGKNTLRVDIFMIVLRYLIPTGNIENVKKVIELIKEHHRDRVPPKRLEHALSLVNIKAGNIEEASALLPQPSEGDELSADVELNPYRKAAKSACMEGDVEYIQNIMTFLKSNNLHYQSLDTFYLLALNKKDDVATIERFYRDRIEEGVGFNEKFMDLLESIIEGRGLTDFKIKE